MHEDTHSVKGHMTVKVPHDADEDLNPDLPNAKIPALNDIFYLFIIHFQILAHPVTAKTSDSQFTPVKQKLRLNIWSGHPLGPKGQ